jgi:hypothetical protein
MGVRTFSVKRSLGMKFMLFLLLLSLSLLLFYRDMIDAKAKSSDSLFNQLLWFSKKNFWVNEESEGLGFATIKSVKKWQEIE